MVNGAKAVPELSDTLESNNPSPRSQIDLGFNITTPEDITVEYVLAALEEKRISGISADDETKSHPVRKTKRMRTKKERVRTRKVSREEDLKEVLRRAFLLPQP